MFQIPVIDYVPSFVLKDSRISTGMGPPSRGVASSLRPRINDCLEKGKERVRMAWRSAARKILESRTKKEGKNSGTRIDKGYDGVTKGGVRHFGSNATKQVLKALI